MMDELIAKEFLKRFGERPDFTVRSPGRVNLIGEHTDYNDGLVMPLAIEQAMFVAVRAREDNKVLLHSLEFDSTTEYVMSDFVREGDDWSEYVKGATWALLRNGYDLKGWEGVITSTIPVGAGLSSSAALDMAALKAFQVVSNFPWDPVKMALLAQMSENKWIGINCGIMDPLIIGLGQKDSAVEIDCRSIEYHAVPVPQKVEIVIVDSGIHRELRSSAYNERRKECEAASRYFGEKSLRDINLEQLDSAKQSMDELIFRRARHVLTENQRVAAAVEAMSANDAEWLGSILKDGHASLRDDFDVSTEEIDALVDIATALPGCYGARLTGGGFGGCIVCLVDEAQTKQFSSSLLSASSEAIGIQGRTYATRGAAGVSATQYGISKSGIRRINEG